MSVQIAGSKGTIFTRSYGMANLEHRVPIRPETVFSLASVTKQFTAAAVLLLMEEGKLKLNDRLAKYVPELASAKDVTVYQLLTQTSGIPDYAEDPAGSKTKSVAKTPQEMLQWIAELKPPLQFKPGTQWAYSSSNYVLLGLVVERVGGAPLPAFFQERLFKRAGITDTAFDNPADVVPHRAQGYRKLKESGAFANADWISATIPGAAGGLRTTSDDLVRWSKALHEGKIVRPDTLRMLASPGLLNDGRTTKFGMPKAWQEGLNSDYGMGVFVTPTRVGPRIWHSGDIDGFSTWLAHYPQRNLTIALLQNSQSADMDTKSIEAAALAMLDANCG